MSKIPYREAIGSLLYLSTMTRPDIAAAVSEVCRFAADPGLRHWHAVQHIFRYIQGTINFVLRYRGGVQVKLFGFADANWATEPDKRRSRGAYVFKLDPTSAAISWKSKLQERSAQSSTASEYISASEAAKEATYLRRLLKDLHVIVDEANLLVKETTEIFEDNKGCISLAKNPVHHERTKHIDVKHHYIRECVEDKTICLTYIPTADQVADLLTKGVTRVILVRLRPQLLGS